MRILFLTQVLPFPLDAGPKVRSYYTLRCLSERHDITLLSFVRPGDSPSAIAHLRTFCKAVHTVPMRRSRTREAWHLVRSLVTGLPFLIARDQDPEMIHTTQALLGGFDVIHADQLWMAAYALGARARTAGDRPPRLVLDQHNAVFQIPRRLEQHETHPLKRALLRLEARKLARYELDSCAQFDRVVWVTREDRAALSEVAGAPRTFESQAGRSSVIPICVDPDEQPVIARRPDARRVTFLGGLHWPPNADGIRWFAREVWPLVRAASSDAVLTVLGRNPPHELTALRAGDARVEVHGYVSDTSRYLAETAVFIVPLNAGGGMRVKILDAWCCGLPVVTTRLGAEGIPVEDGTNALVADTPEAFAQAVVRVLSDPTLASRLGARGRETVEANYHWHTIYPAWERIYAGLLESDGYDFSPDSMAALER